MSDLTSAIKDLEKSFKKTNPDLIFDADRKIEAVSSGDVIFDLVSGCGGFPKGRLTELFGMEGSCKSSLLFSALAGVQREGGVGILFDHENSFSADYARNTFGLEVDNKTFALITPDNIEQGMAVFDKLTGGGDGKTEGLDRIDLICFDSIDSMKPEAIINAQAGKEARIGSQAKAVGLMFHKAKAVAKKYDCPIVFTNQMRVNINTSQGRELNVGTGAGFNVTESYTTPGGYAPRFYSSLRMKLEYAGQLSDDVAINPISGKQEKQRYGNKYKVINVKNRCGVPYRKASTFFIFPTDEIKGGFNKGLALLEIMKARGHAKQRSTKFTYEGYEVDDFTNSGSKVKSEELFLSNPEYIEDMYKRVLSYLEAGIGSGNSNKGGNIFDMLSAEEIAEIKKLEKADSEKASGKITDMMEDEEDNAPPVEEITL